MQYNCIYVYFGMKNIWSQKIIIKVKILGIQTIYNSKYLKMKHSETSVLWTLLYIYKHYI